MVRWCLAILAASYLWGSSTARVFAHPASGIVVSANGKVFFIHTGHGVCRIDAEGGLIYIHKVKGGGHFLALDVEGIFSTQFPRLFEKVAIGDAKPTLLYASGGAPFVVSRDGNLYYGSGYPDGDDMAPGFHTLTRLSPDGKQTLFAPDLKKKLADMNESVAGLAEAPDGSLLVAGPNAILKVKLDGAASTIVHPVDLADRGDDLAKDSQTRAFHSPYLRGIDVTEDGTIYGAVNGCRCVVKIMPMGKVEIVLKAEKPWSPTGVAVRGKDLFVLEYTNTDKEKDWVPRVRKLDSKGKVTNLADLTRDEKKR